MEFNSGFKGLIMIRRNYGHPGRRTEQVNIMWERGCRVYACYSWWYI